MTLLRKTTVGVALISIGRFLSVSVLQLLYPMDLIFESPTWNTALLLHKGINIYSPQTFDAPPFNLNLYTPLYFALVSIIPGFSQSPLIVGRAVSLFFAGAAMALLVFTTTAKNRFQTGLIGVGWLLLFAPVLVNGAFFRMEFMALFFSACAVACLRRQTPSSKGTVLAAFFCVLSIMSKQTFIVAPVACFIYLFLSARRDAFRFAAWVCLLLGAALYSLYRYCGEGFLWSILVAPRQPLSFEWFGYNLNEMLTPCFFTLAVLSTAASYVILRSAKTKPLSAQSARPDLLNAVYCFLSWLWAFATIGKIGASTNYFIEPLFASVWLLMTWVDAQEEDWAARRICSTALLLLPLLFAAEILITRHEPRYLLAPRINIPEAFQHIKRELEALGIPSSPKILNLAHGNHSLSVGWDLYLNDPVLYSVLWHTRTLPNRTLIEAIDSQFFDAIALRKGARRDSITDPPLHEIYEKIFDRYEVRAEQTLTYLVRSSK